MPIDYTAVREAVEVIACRSCWLLNAHFADGGEIAFLEYYEAVTAPRWSSVGIATLSELNTTHWQGLYRKIQRATGK